MSQGSFDSPTPRLLKSQRWRYCPAMSLSTVVNGIAFDNPFLLASGPPGTNGKVIAKSFELGWGEIGRAHV